MKIGDKVEVLTGDYEGHTGIIFHIAARPYPITVEFPNGDLNSYYEEQLKEVL